MAASTRHSSEPALRRLREACLSLPDARERLSHGEPTWFAGGRRAVVMLADHHHDDRFGFWAAAPEGVQGRLVAEDPDRYFVPPYVGGRGWLGVRLGATTAAARVNRPGR